MEIHDETAIRRLLEGAGRRTEWSTLTINRPDVLNRRVNTAAMHHGNQSKKYGSTAAIKTCEGMICTIRCADGARFLPRAGRCQGYGRRDMKQLGARALAATDLNQTWSHHRATAGVSSRYESTWSSDHRRD